MLNILVQIEKLSSNKFNCCKSIYPQMKFQINSNLVYLLLNKVQMKFQINSNLVYLLSNEVSNKVKFSLSTLK